MSELAFHRAAAAYLTVVLRPPTWWTTIPAGWGRLGKAMAGQLKACGLKAGVPDILIVNRGLCHWLELKSASGRLSEAQILTRGALERAGCYWGSARSIDDVEANLRLWGLLADKP